MITRPTKSNYCFALSEKSEQLCSNLDELYSKTEESLLEEFLKQPEDKAAQLLMSYPLMFKLFKGAFCGNRFEAITSISKEVFAEYLIMHEKLMTSHILSRNFATIIKFINPHFCPNGCSKTCKAFFEFKNKYIADTTSTNETPIPQALKDEFYTDIKYVRNSAILNEIMTQHSLDSFKLEMGTKRAVFIHNAFTSLALNANLKRAIQELAPPKLPKCVIFISFLNTKNLELIDVKLNAIEDPAYERKVREDFKCYVESFPVLQSAKKTTLSSAEKMAAMLEALKDELDSSPASASSTPPKAKKTIPAKASAPCAPLDQNLYQTPTKPARERIEEPLLKVRPMSKKEAQSPDWQPVEAAKKQLEVTPAKMLQKILSSKFEVEPKDRILRWMNVTDLNSIKLFQDMSLEGQGKKLVKRYERMSDEELYKQALRHCVPSIVLPILSNPNFVESYCFQKNRCYFAKVKIVMPSSRFCEETILSFAINDQNQIYHWFIHPQEEIEFEKELSDIPKEPDVEFEKHPQAARSAYAGERLEGIALENKNLLGISINYLHPINRNPMQLIIFPRN